MNDNILLAKSEPRISLDVHIKDCLIIFKELQKAFPNVIKSFNGDWHYWDILRLCILFHDLGKAHKEFQKVLNKEKNKWEGRRHELYSLPFISAMVESDALKRLLILVTASHHKDIEDVLKKYICIYQTSLSNNELLQDELLDFEKDFLLNVDQKSVIELLEAYSIDVKIISNAPLSDKILNKYFRNINSVSNRDGEDFYFQLLLIFGGLKHCDHLGSAQLKEISTIGPSDFKFLDTQRERLVSQGDNFYQHQLECSDAIGNVILTSPTGSGKTESAMLWLKKQMESSGQGRVFYILPFTASINAMYERLGGEEKGFHDPEHIKVGMIHGKLTDYLYDHFDDYQYSISERKEEIQKIKDKFKTISVPVKVISPFQLLKHLYGLKGFEQGIFEMVGSYFIFDEIHAYSADIFAQIKVLLEYTISKLNVKSLIMTATLPVFLKDELKKVTTFQEIKASPELYSKFDRHKVVLKEGLLKDNYELIIRDLEKDLKVLVVCNTVLQSQETFKALKAYSKKSVLLHGAFNGEDRNMHEIELRKGENKDNPVKLLVGTQAIEVSLDIDYDVIYTEPAPFDALIQRFGRVNRKCEKGICEVIIFKGRNESDKYIYQEDIVIKTLEILHQIIIEDEGIIKEVKLQLYMDDVYPSWSKKNLETFNWTYDLFSNSVSQLVPFINSKHKEDTFYEQFDGIKVLPSGLKSRFSEAINAFDFIGAERLKIQIRKRKFTQLKKSNDMILQKEIMILDTSHKLLKIQYWILNCRYDTELGINYEELEVWNNDTQI